MTATYTPLTNMEYIGIIDEIKDKSIVKPLYERDLTSTNSEWLKFTNNGKYLTRGSTSVKFVSPINKEKKFIYFTLIFVKPQGEKGFYSIDHSSIKPIVFVYEKSFNINQVNEIRSSKFNVVNEVNDYVIKIKDYVVNMEQKNDNLYYSICDLEKIESNLNHTDDHKYSFLIGDKRNIIGDNLILNIEMQKDESIFDFFKKKFKIDLSEEDFLIDTNRVFNQLKTILYTNKEADDVYSLIKNILISYQPTENENEALLVWLLKNEHFKKNLEETSEDQEKEQNLKNEYLEKEKKLKNEYLQKEQSLNDKYLQKEKNLNDEYLEKEQNLNDEYLEKEQNLNDEYLEKEQNLDNKYLQKEQNLKNEYLEKEQNLKNEYLEKEQNLKNELNNRLSNQRQEIAILEEKINILQQIDYAQIHSKFQSELKKLEEDATDTIVKSQILKLIFDQYKLGQSEQKESRSLKIRFDDLSEPDFKTEADIFSQIKNIQNTKVEDALKKLHAIFQSGLFPILSGQGSHHLLKLYAYFFCKNRLKTVQILPDQFDPLDLSNINYHVKEPQNRFSLMIFDGINLAPTESYLLPFLRNQIDPFFETDNDKAPILMAGILTDGPTTLKLCRDIWFYSAHLHIEPFIASINKDMTSEIDVEEPKKLTPNFNQKNISQYPIDHDYIISLASKIFDHLMMDDDKQKYKCIEDMLIKPWYYIKNDQILNNAIHRSEIITKYI